MVCLAFSKSNLPSDSFFIDAKRICAETLNKVALLFSSVGFGGSQYQEHCHLEVLSTPMAGHVEMSGDWFTVVQADVT